MSAPTIWWSPMIGIFQPWNEKQLREKEYQFHAQPLRGVNGCPWWRRRRVKQNKKHVPSAVNPPSDLNAHSFPRPSEYSAPFNLFFFHHRVSMQIKSAYNFVAAPPPSLSGATWKHRYLCIWCLDLSLAFDSSWRRFGPISDGVVDSRPPVLPCLSYNNSN